MRANLQFGVSFSNLGDDRLSERARAIERLGFDVLYAADHLPGARPEPLVYLSWAAACTERLHVTPLVLGNDFRNPVLLGKQAATLDRLSGGRLELGLGAGWWEADYRMLGTPFPRITDRIGRLKEALGIFRSYWKGEPFDFTGRHYDVRGVEPGPRPSLAHGPPLLIGGGAPQLMALAGRLADIVSPIPRLRGGAITADFYAEMSRERFREKLEQARAAAARAGRDPATLRFQAVVNYAAVAEGAADSARLRGRLMDQTGLTIDQINESPNILIGTAEFICDRILRDHEELGFQDWALIGGDRGFARVNLASFERFAHEVLPALHHLRAEPSAAAKKSAASDCAVAR